LQKSAVYLFLVFMLIRLCCVSQNENTKWYFGGHAALDFMTSPPTILFGSAMATYEGCSSIANSAGNLLFYTDGITVYNQLNLVMANGTGLLGNNSPCQSSVITKQPGSSGTYYIFTVQGVAGSAGMNYSVVDMSLAGGQGSVTVKNAPLYPMPCSEQITGTRHCNGTDVWVVCHDRNTTQFKAFLLTAAGVNTIAVTSAVGGTPSILGCLKISPNGKKLGAAHYSEGTWMFDFDNSTGSVSNGIALNLSYWPYGCEFSGDGTKFYASNFIPSVGTSALKQWDLCAGSATAIVASKYSDSLAINGMYSMQLAPDGKIYIASGTTSLNVINNPNAAGSACNFIVGAQATALTNTVSRSLPNFILIPTTSFAGTIHANGKLCVWL
jgi:hypothetical protein